MLSAGRAIWALAGRAAVARAADRKAGATRPIRLLQGKRRFLGNLFIRSLMVLRFFTGGCFLVNLRLLSRPGRKRGRRRRTGCFDLLNYDGGYPLDSSLALLVGSLPPQRLANSSKLHSHGLPSGAV